MPEQTPTLAPCVASKMVVAGHPVLRARAAEVPASDLGTKALKSLVRSMVEVMRKAPGVGLAAPQLGVASRVFVMEDGEALMAALTHEQRAARERRVFPLLCVVNPVLTRLDGPSATFFEGCLSVPGYMALVERSLAVRVEGTDPDGAPLALELRGWPARIAQHEADHLDGTLYVDRMMPRTFGANAEVRERWLALPPEEVKRTLG